MADEIDLSEDKKPLKKLMPLIIGGLAFVAIAISATLYFMGVFSVGQENRGKQEETSKLEDTEPPKAPLYLTLDPAFVVSFANKKGAKLLQLSVSVLSYKQDVIDAIKKHNPMVRNSLLLLLSAQDPQDLKTLGGKNRLRTEIFDVITRVIKEIEGLEGVEDVFFTNLVMQ